MIKKEILRLTLLICMFSTTAVAQKHTIHGYIKDKSSGEALIGANVIIKGTNTGTVTNSYGFYSLSLIPGNYTLVISYMGYQEMEKQIELTSDISLNPELDLATENIDEVVVTAQAKNENIVSSKMGVEKLTGRTIEKIPVLLGEADVMKALKLLPGVVSTSEMSSNLSIRGGARDQNMILLDEATVYNASHLLGLFSVFNNDAIKSVEMYKGSIPSQYGGRISSVIDIRMKEGNARQLTGTGSLGVLTSRITLEAPIIKDKASILISARRTYIDLIMKQLHKANSTVPELPYYFYDYNAKANFTINDNNRIYLSGYFGRDVSKFEINEDNSMINEWGNYTGTIRWNYMISKKLFANVTLLASNYNYLIESRSVYGEEKKEQVFSWKAFIKDYSVKADFNHYLTPVNSLRYGIGTTHHDFNIAEIEGHVDTFNFDFKIPKYYSLESSAYVSNIQKVGNAVTLDYGLRTSMSQNIGSGTIYKLENYEVVDTVKYSRNEIYKTYYGLEPRVAATWVITDNTSLKAGYSRTVQYVNVASNSNAGTPLDVWMPVTPNVKPQYGDQVSVGLFRNFFDNVMQTSVEVYYKKMNNQIEFREFSNPYFNPQIESDFRFGEGRAYGIEFMVKKAEGQFTGWVSYTLANSERKIRDIQEKDWFPSPYDHRHNVSVVGMYDITRRLSLSANWVYMTGQPFDAPAARWQYGNMILPYYDGKNGSRYPDYHRLDLGLEWKNKPLSKFNSSWTLSVYNAYNHKNANMIYFVPESDNVTKAYRMAMLQRIFAVSFNFNF